MTSNAIREGFGDDAQSLRTFMAVFGGGRDASSDRWRNVDQFVSEVYLETRGIGDAPGLDDLNELFRDLALYIGYLSSLRAHLAYRVGEMDKRLAERRKEEEELAQSLDRVIARRLDIAADLPTAERRVLSHALELQASLGQALDIGRGPRPRRSPRVLYLARCFVREVRAVWSFLLQRDMSRSTDRQMLRFAVAVWRDVNFYEADPDLFGWLLRRFREVKTD